MSAFAVSAAVRVVSAALMLLSLSTSAVCAAADGGTAASAFSAARARGDLAVGLAYPLPAYIGGAKYRTPESPDATLAAALAKQLKLSLNTPKVNPADAPAALAAGRADAVLVLADEAAPANPKVTLVATGYSAGAMAIMRSDTDIKSWEQLKGRTVCLSEGGAYVGKIAARYGAIEKVQRAPADSLLSLRIGACDAAVHDDTMLNALLKLPEWKKFSARLPVQSRQMLAFAVRSDDAAAISYLQQLAASWSGSGFLADLKKQWVNNVAFEVYLDQTVPDCH